MEIPKLITGSEEKFADFIFKINKEDRVALISHNDLDGLVSARVVNMVLKVNLLKFIDYIEINEYLINELREMNINKVIFTDINIDDYKIINSISKFAEIMIIDHHKFEKDFNSERVTFLNAHGFCCGYLCYYLFLKLKNIEKIDWLVSCSCLSDWLFTNNSNWLNGVYGKYGETFSSDNDKIKKSKMWAIQEDLSASILYFRPNLKRVYDQIGEKFGEIGDLGKYAFEVKREIKKSLEKFSTENMIINGIYFWEVSAKYPVKDVVVNVLSMEKPNSTFIVAERKGNYYKVSARRQDKKVDLPKLLKSLVVGFKNASAGGHIPASGANFPVEYYEEFKKRLRNMR